MLRKIFAFSFIVFFTTSVFAHNNVTTPLSDTALTAYLKTKMAATPSLPSSNVHVTTRKGTVILTGVVPTDDDASKVIETVQSTNGVKNVNATKLKVEKSQQPFTDTVITA